MATYVMVHGAFQGAWVYTKVAQLLREAGHDVYTPELTGLGERSHLVRPINLDTHIQDILNVFHFHAITDAVLCGHSYGGMVITGVANRLSSQIRSLFYLDAYAPLQGQSLMDITGPETALAFLSQAASTGTTIPPIPASVFNVNETDAARVDALSVPQPLATFVQAARDGVDSVAITALERTFIYAAKNGGNWFDSTYAWLKKEAGWKVHELPCGHSMMLDCPKELVALLTGKS